MARCLALAIALALLPLLVISSNEALTVEECPSVIREAYGREDLDEVLRETFGQIKEKAVTRKECLSICRQISKCEEAILKIDMKRSNTRKFLLIVKIAFKILVVHKRLTFMDLPFSTLCDMLQFWLHVDHPILERVVGVVGNMFYGAFLWCDLGGAAIGGITGLSLWIYSEVFYIK
jgi:hypothetical protein